MIKLANPTNAPRAFSVLTLESVGTSPSISISTGEARKQIEGEWTVDPQRLKQSIVFTNGAGEAVTLEGLVDEDKAIEISGAHRVILEVGVSTELKGAFAAGRKSSLYAELEILRILEVWSTRTVKLWESPERKALGSQAATMDSTGKVS